MRKILTLSYVVRKRRILLGMKKRGFGVGRWNGFGGKVEAGETIEEGARREMQEESGVVIEKMEKVGIHEFRFENNPEEILEVHVFRIDTFDGKPMETEEMRPQWFDFDAILYDEMWASDHYWLPLVLEGKKLRTKFLFDENDALLKQDVLIVSQI